MRFLRQLLASTLIRWLAIAAIAVLVGLAGGWKIRGIYEAQKPQRQSVAPVQRLPLNKGSEALDRGINSLRSQLESITGTSAPSRPPPAVLSDQGLASEEEVIAVLNRVRTGMADLVMLTNQLKARQPMLAAERSLRLTFTESGAIERRTIDHLARHRSITLTNRGSDSVINPRVIVNSEKNWFDNGLLLNEIIKPGMSKRDKAVAIWRFLVDNRIHDESAHFGIELHDPVRWLNNYGYGLCDDAATSYMRLAKKAGLKARVWELTSHIVPEVYYDDAWHLLDPDGEVYYLDDDNQTIASIERLEQRADLIRRQPENYYDDVELMVGLYTTPDNNRLVPWHIEHSETVHTMAFRLRPGESLMRSWSNWGLYFTAGYLEEPKRYGNGRFLFEPVFKGDLYKKGSERSDGLTVQVRAGGTTLTTVDPARSGTLVYHFQSPYPYLSGAIQLAGEIADGGTVKIEFSEHGKRWQLVESFSKKGLLQQKVSLQGYFRNGYGRPFYSYYIRLTLDSPATGTTVLSALQYSSDIQLAPHALPTLQAGENTILYQDDTPGGRNVEVLFEYDDVE